MPTTGAASGCPRPSRRRGAAEASRPSRRPVDPVALQPGGRDAHRRIGQGRGRREPVRQEVEVGGELVAGDDTFCDEPTRVIDWHPPAPVAVAVAGGDRDRLQGAQLGEGRLDGRHRDRAVQVWLGLHAPLTPGGQMASPSSTTAGKVPGAVYPPVDDEYSVVSGTPLSPYSMTYPSVSSVAEIGQRALVGDSPVGLARQVARVGVPAVAPRAAAM